MVGVTTASESHATATSASASTWTATNTSDPADTADGTRGISEASLSGRTLKMTSAAVPAVADAGPSSIYSTPISSTTKGGGVPKTGQNRRTSRPHLALRGTTWHKSAPYMYARTCAFEGPLGSPRRAIQPSSREKTAHDLRVGELQWAPDDGENVTNRTVNAPLKTGQNAAPAMWTAPC